MAALLEQVRLIIEQIILALGYPGIAIVMFTENIFPPIPSELVMPFAGFLVGRGELNFFMTLAAGTLGAVLGAVVLYYIGLWADEPIVRRFIRRYGKFFLLSESDIDRVLTAFQRHGQAIVFFGRLIPIIRSLISLPAGMQRMPMLKFLFFTTLGATLWNIALLVGGVILGANWDQILGIVRQYETLTLIVLIVLVVIFVAVRLRERRRKRAASPASD